MWGLGVAGAASSDGDSKEQDAGSNASNDSQRRKKL